MTLHATFPATGLTATKGGRRISGTAVPWGEIGTVSDGRRVRFLPGSLDAAGRPPVLRDHDPQRPIGRVVEARDTGHGIDVDTTISATVSGDEALVLAGDGILAAWSVGVDPTDTRPGDDGVLEIVAGSWRELSLLTFGAFAGAQVVDVAAEQGPDEDEDEEVEEPEEEEPDPEEEPVSTTQLEPVHAGTIPAVPILAAPRPEPPTDLTAVARLIASMPNARADRIEAALADLTTTTGAGAVRPAFQDRISNAITFGRPTINAISNAALPPSGMAVEWPMWGVVPNVAQQATQKTEIATAAATITTGTAPVLTWAGGADVALQLAQRSNPSFLEQWVERAAEDYARETNAYVITSLLAAAEVVAPAATPTFLNSIALLFSSFDPATVPNGNLFLAMSWDVGAVMIGVSATSGPAFWDGSINFGNVMPTAGVGGLNAFVDRQLPAKTMLMGVSEGATWYESPGAPAELRVIDVALLGINIGVYGFGALGLNYAGTPNPAFEKMTFTTLPADFAVSNREAKK